MGRTGDAYDDSGIYQQQKPRCSLLPGAPPVPPSEKKKELYSPTTTASFLPASPSLVRTSPNSTQPPSPSRTPPSSKVPFIPTASPWNPPMNAPSNPSSTSYRGPGSGATQTWISLMAVVYRRRSLSVTWRWAFAPRGIGEEDRVERVGHAVRPGVLESDGAVISTVRDAEAFGTGDDAAAVGVGEHGEAETVDFPRTGESEVQSGRRPSFIFHAG
ncbi:hypothetical protein KC360_g137 [Hortaea werneckii]|nr:hypothetical protein KC360_g137 [Hortaea werneckii]